MENLKGLGVAMVTPFNEDGNVDHPAIERLVEHMITGGVDYLVVHGTTGESVTLTKEEKRATLDTVLQVNKGRVPVVVGIGGNNTAAVVETLKTFDLEGVDAILSVSPAYNKPTQEGIYQHYLKVADASAKPVILYNVPGRTASNVTAEITLRLAQHPNIVAVKEASGDLDQIGKIIDGAPEGFMVISGDDGITAEIIERGGQGVISVIGNALPVQFNEVVMAALKGDHASAKARQSALTEMIDNLFVEGNPAGVKEVLKHLGICGNTVRLPLVPVGEGTSKTLRALMDGLRTPAV